MENDSESEDIAREPNQQSSVDGPSKPPGNDNPPSDATHHGGNNDRTDIEEDIRSGERWLIVVGILAVLVNGLIAAIYYGQLTQMRQATKATQQTAYTACVSAQIARGALLEAQAESEGTRQMIRSSGYQAAAATQSEVAFIEPQFPPVVTVPLGHRISIPLTFINIGKTDAFDFKAAIKAIFFPRGQDFKFIYPASSSRLTVGRFS
jgi:hypothetical protein